MEEDRALLRRYAEEKSQDAFAAVARRHVDWVHSCALREVRDSHLAEDVTQAVFIVLVGKAGRIGPSVSVMGWLFRAVRLAAKEALRGQRRRRIHEQRAGAMRIDQADGRLESDWEEIKPQLDAAVSRLGREDRDAVLLRFYRGLSHAEVGSEMGLSAEAAKKRVQRAIDRLRGDMAGNGLSIGAAGLELMIASKVTAAAPASLVQMVSGAPLGGAAAADSIAKGVWKMMAWTRLKIAATVVAVAVTAVGGTMVVAEMRSPAVAAAGSAPTTVPATGEASGPADAKDGFATVLDKVRTVHSVSYKQTVRTTANGRPLTVTADVMVGASLVMRQTMHMPDGGEMIQIMDLKARKMLTLDPAAKRAIVVEMTDPASDTTPKNLLDTLMTARPKDAAIVGVKTIEGRPATGFKIETSKSVQTMTVWADNATHLPVQIDMTMQLGSLLPPTSATSSQFKWDERIDESLLSVAPPAGYQVQTMKMNGSAPKEKDLTESLASIAEFNNGDYPDALDMGTWSRIAGQAAAKVKQGSPEGRALLPRLTEVSTHVGQALAFYGDAKNGEDWHYAGKGIAAGESGVPILWYRPAGSATYRVIDADLTIHDVAPADLPKVPSVPMRAP